MEIEGTIYKILPRELVTFGDGTQKAKGGFVISCNIDYPHYVAFELFGEERLVMLEGLSAGMPIRVNFYAESRESKNGNFYTALKCFGITTLATQNPASAGLAPVEYPNSVPPTATVPPVQNTPQVSGTASLLSDDDEVPF